MATLLISAIGLGAQKIKERRDDRKQKKAVLQWEEERSFETARKAALRDAEDVRREERRKSDILEEERAQSRRSASLEREGEVGLAPPSYDEVVGGST